MTITILGAGCGKAALTEEARRALEEAELVIGAKRLLDDLQTAIFDGDTSGAQGLCKRAQSVLAERNRICKLNK